MLVDLRSKGVTGKAAQLALDRANITCNKNGVPFDDKSPLVTSGIRLGTPALTTRGMGEPEMQLVARLIDRVVSNIDNADEINAVKSEVVQQTSRFPIHA
jgi:glycine hydroxymethyltransferase